MNIKSKQLNAVFYQTETGNEPVREWLKNLLKLDKKTIGNDIKTIQFGWPIGMPLVDNLGHGLWEVRTKLTGSRIARVIFFMDSNTMVLVNGFIKKTRKTPNPELDLARKRKKQYELITARAVIASQLIDLYPCVIPRRSLSGTQRLFYYLHLMYAAKKTLGPA